MCIKEIKCKADTTWKTFRDTNTVLTRSKKAETAVHCCDPALSVLVVLVSRNVFHVVSSLQSIAFKKFNAVLEIVVYFSVVICWLRCCQININKLNPFYSFPFIDRTAQVKAVGEYLYWNWNFIFHSHLGDCAHRLENVSRETCCDKHLLNKTIKEQT